MLKTNSKAARENIHAYILEHFDPTGYDLNHTPETFEDVARVILDTFQTEKHPRSKRIPMQAVFTEWASGLPSILDTCYYYNRSAVADLGAILAGIEAARQQYSENSAEGLLTYLIYRELIKGAAQ